MDLFQATVSGHSHLPLPERMRPASLNDFIGQPQALKFLSPFLNQPEHLPNIILWGPPGSGKTTLARLVARMSKAEFVNLNAVETGVKEIRNIGDQAHMRKIQGLGQTVIFIDEIHRLNRGQQDVLLPYTEAGDFFLIGATTENPSYELNAALLSRARVVILHPLSGQELQTLLERGVEKLGYSLAQILDQEAIGRLLEFADGDARKLLGALETLVPHSLQLGTPLNPSQIADVLQRPSLRYDKKSDEHYNTISAFIKSIRGSDPDAAVYYLARMLKGGEDPVFIARRLVILASEDVGNADPRALSLAVAGLQAVELVGLPEAAISLSQVTTYLSSAPKSNASYQALKGAQAEVEKSGTLPVPLALRSARTRLTKDLGYGEGYRYAHDGPTGWQDMDFLPESLVGRVFYQPTTRGFEKNIRDYLDWMKGKKTNQP